MPTATTPPTFDLVHLFDLPEHLAAKADPALVADDREHFARIAESLTRQVTSLQDALDELRRAPAGKGTRALDRDLEIHHVTARLRTLRRYGLDLCLGRMVSADGSPTVYIGRLGLVDENGEPLLVDWRTPAAEPYFAATRSNPLGLASRRRYRWTDGRITDYWDETVAGVTGSDGGLTASLDDESAFIASLGGSRSETMRDVLGTIQADQDAIIRAGSSGALVVDGGPGTGKTVVALHRAAFLLYNDPRLNTRRGGVLVVGPSHPYLDYVADVLPSLGEDGVQTCTVRDLVAEGRGAVAEADVRTARLKADVRMVAAIEPAIRLYEEPPAERMLIETQWADVPLLARDWIDAFAAAEVGVPHNEARDQVWEALVEILEARFADEGGFDEGATPEQLRRSLVQNEGLTRTFSRAWPVIDPAELVSDLWAVPAYLRRCAPWLSDEEVRLLQRAEDQPWTFADLPLLDAARARIGDPEAVRQRRRQESALAEQRATMNRVVDDLLESKDYDDGEGTIDVLHQQQVRDALVDTDVVTVGSPDELAGPFAHVVVDEAQELTDAEWQMVLRRCPSRSVTVVGDRAQARHGFVESWSERLERVGLGGGTVAEMSLTINYRTPEEVMAEAAPVIRAALPDANVPTSVRTSGIPVRHGRHDELDRILASWESARPDGIACVMGDPGFRARPRVRSLTPETAKGLEFDLVVLVAPQTWGDGVTGAVDRYVAMTRTTQELVVLDVAP